MNSAYFTFPLTWGHCDFSLFSEVFHVPLDVLRKPISVYYFEGDTHYILGVKLA